MGQQLRLRPRLQLLADLTPPCRVLADIGTDHGYLPVALLRSGRIARAIASDLRQAPLAHARRTAVQFGVAEAVDFRLGDGLAVLTPGEAETVVVAGMGGDAIAAILAAAPWAAAVPCVLLQPMSKAEVLRRWLPENGWRVCAERLAEDKGTLYPVLSVAGGAMPAATEGQAWGGFRLADDPLWGRYLSEQSGRLERAAAGLLRSEKPELAVKREAFLRAAAELKQRKGEWEYAHRT